MYVTTVQFWDFWTPSYLLTLPTSISKLTCLVGAFSSQTPQADVIMSIAPWVANMHLICLGSLRVAAAKIGGGAAAPAIYRLKRGSESEHSTQACALRLIVGPTLMLSQRREERRRETRRESQFSPVPCNWRMRTPRTRYLDLTA